MRFMPAEIANATPKTAISVLRSQVWDKPEVIGHLMSASPAARILEEVAREGEGVG